MKQLPLQDMMEWVLVTDDDSHWYVIPAIHEDTWWDYDWESADYEAPVWATPVGGAPSRVRFTGWAIK